MKTAMPLIPSTDIPGSLLKDEPLIHKGLQYAGWGVLNSSVAHSKPSILSTPPNLHYDLVTNKTLQLGSTILPVGGETSAYTSKVLFSLREIWVTCLADEGKKQARKGLRDLESDRPTKPAAQESTWKKRKRITIWEGDNGDETDKGKTGECLVVLTATQAPIETGKQPVSVVQPIKVPAKLWGKGMKQVTFPDWSNLSDMGIRASIDNKPCSVGIDDMKYEIYDLRGSR